MTPPSPDSLQTPAASAAPLDVLAEVARLTGLLDQEFEALKSRNLDALERLQEDKGQILTLLAGAPELGAERMDDAVRRQLLDCQQAHLRNTQLMQRQLDAVRGALQALQGQEALASVDLYDRMGQMSRRAGFLNNQLA